MDRAGFVGSASASLSNLAISASAKTLRPSSATALAPVRTQVPVSTPSLNTQLAPARLAHNFHSGDSFGKGTGKVIVLFRSDLRLDDHPALSHAIEDAASVIPVFCFDPRHFGRTEHGFEKTGKYRARFLIESVEDLRKNLQARGSDLVVRMGKPEDVIPDLVKKIKCRSVFVHREVTYEEQQVEEALEKCLKNSGADLKTFWANTLFHEDDLPFDINNMPDVYSDFREKVEKSGTIRTPLPAPEKVSQIPKAISAGEIPTLSTLGIDDTPRTMSTSAGVSAVTGGESEATQRVKAYVSESKRFEAEQSPRAKVTAHLGADFSCRISPWLALGCISPRRIFDEMKKASRRPENLLRSSTYFELVWRDFFRCITAKYSNKRSSAGSRSLPRRKAMVVS